jgi:hypothetical protein
MTEKPEAIESDQHLLQLVLSLESAAMQQMGKLQNPFTGQVEKNLDMAKNSIDLLAMIERKTAGNLTQDEESLIKRALYQLRLNYVDELKAEEQQQANEKERPTGTSDDRNEVPEEQSAGGQEPMSGEPEE